MTHARRRSIFDVPRSPNGVIVLALAWVAVAGSWFASPWFPIASLRTVQDATGGWLHVNLLSNWMLSGVLLLVVVTLGRQRWRDIGWRTAQWPVALAATVALWLAMQLAAWWTNGHVVAAPWSKGGGLVIGALIAQLLGTALLEETVFRGWLWPQMALRFGAARRPIVAGTLAALASQALFALAHVPVGLRDGDVGQLAGLLVMLFATGLVFVLIYAATRNLWLAVGIHALGNTPTMWIEPGRQSPTMVLLAGALVIAAAAAVYTRRQSSSGETG